MAKKSLSRWNEGLEELASGLPPKGSATKDGQKKSYPVKDNMPKFGAAREKASLKGRVQHVEKSTRKK